MQETESESAAQQVAAIPATVLAVPASLHASLMARLDRLGSAKEVAQNGAVIGREYSHALIVAVARKPKVELISAHDRLMAAGLLFRQGLPPDATEDANVDIRDRATGDPTSGMRRERRGRTRPDSALARARPRLLRARALRDRGLGHPQEPAEIQG